MNRPNLNLIQNNQLSFERKQDIANLAEAVALEYQQGNKIDPCLIAKVKGITYNYNHYGNAFDGMLEHKNGRFHIFCNLARTSTPDSPRSRFTFGHELGHYFIDEHRLALQSGKVPAHGSKIEYSSKNIIEVEADCFASNLLMPSSSFGGFVKKAGCGAEAIIRTVGRFDVSITAAAVRYVNESIIPCAIIKWSPEGYRWKLLSNETFQARYFKTIERLEDIPRNSATAQAVLGASTPSTGFFQSGATAADWFRSVAREGNRNVIFIEEAIPLGNYGVLTVLYPEDREYKFDFIP